MRPRGNEAGSLCFCPLRVWCAGSTYCWGTPRSPESRDVAPTWSMLGWMRCCGSVALRVDACGGTSRGRFRGYFPGALPGVLPGVLPGGRPSTVLMQGAAACAAASVCAKRSLRHT